MADSNLVQLIKRIVAETVEADKPCDYQVGTVVSVSPLKVKLSQTLTLDEDFLDVARNVTDFEVDVSITSGYGWNTEEQSGGDGDAAFTSHAHAITASGKKTMVHNGLKTGDKVLLLRKQRGQRYAVIDKVVSG